MKKHKRSPKKVTLRKFFLWLLGLALARIFFPLGILWLVLGSLAYFPLKDVWLFKQEQRKQRKYSQRYLQMLEAANVYFQDAYSVSQYLDAMKKQRWDGDLAWKKSLHLAAGAYQQGVESHRVAEILAKGLPKEADFFLEALFGPQAFQEQLREISLSSLQYYRQKLRLQLELQAELSAQSSEAKIMMGLPCLFKLFLPTMLGTQESFGVLEMCLSSLAWFLVLAAISIFVKFAVKIHALEVDQSEISDDFLLRLYRKMPPFHLFVLLWNKLLEIPGLAFIQETFLLSHSTGRTSLNAKQETASDLSLYLARAQSWGFCLGLFLALVLQNVSFCLLFFIFPLVAIWRLKLKKKTALREIKEQFPATQHRMYLYLVSGYSLDNAWQAVINDLPPGALLEDWQSLHYLEQGGRPILELLNRWSGRLGIPEVQESLALLQRHVESGSRDSLLRFGEQILNQQFQSELEQHEVKGRLSSMLMIPIMLDLISIIILCLTPALGTFTGLSL